MKKIKNLDELRKDQECEAKGAKTKKKMNQNSSNFRTASISTVCVPYIMPEFLKS